MLHAEVYGHGLARRCAGNGWGHRKRRRSGSRRPDPAADGRTVRGARGQGITAPIRGLVPLLLHFSTFNWFVGGLDLIVAASSFEQEARLATGLLVGSSYLFGALGNLWATRGRHPGWMLYAVAVLLIAYGVGQPNG